MDWDPSQPLPLQIADAFACLFDWLSPNHFETIDNFRWNPLEDRSTANLISLVSSSGDQTPDRFQQLISDANTLVSEIELVRLLYSLIISIDRGLELHHPANASRKQSSSRLLERYDRSARYNTDSVRGYVLPKWTSRRYRGNAFADHFKNLVRANVDHDRIRVIGRTVRSYRRRRGNPKVAVVPFLYRLFQDDAGPADARFVGIDEGENHYFNVELGVDDRSVLEERVKSCVNAIRASDLTIAVFPELALDSHLLNFLCSQLRETDSDQSVLDWVIVGCSQPSTGDVYWPYSNEAHVLDSAGNIVTDTQSSAVTNSWIQKKHHRYKLSSAEQRRYGVEWCFDEQCDREEAIAIGREHYFFEDRSGRYSVLICEDWSQAERALEDIRKLLCRIVFVIVMDGPVENGRWSANQADTFVAQTGGMAVIANSLLLPNSPKIREYRASKRDPIPDPYPDQKQNVGILAIPQEDDRDPVPHSFFEIRATPDPDNDQSLLSNSIEIALMDI